MPIGTVKWFNVQKGYGLIPPEDAAKDVFAHITALERAGIDRLREGRKVSYEVGQDRGKPSAGNLKMADQRDGDVARRPARVRRARACA